MDVIEFRPFMVVGLAATAVSLAWQIAVIVLLYKIWQKVKHLPRSPSAP